MEIKQNKTKKNKWILNGKEVSISNDIREKFLNLIKKEDYDNIISLLEDKKLKVDKINLILIVFALLSFSGASIYLNYLIEQGTFSALTGALSFSLPFGLVGGTIVNQFIVKDNYNQIINIITKEKEADMYRKKFKVLGSDKNKENENAQKNSFNFKKSPTSNVVDLSETKNKKR